MRSATTHRLGAALIAGVGLIHLVLAPEYLGQQLYVGVLFLAGAAASAYVAARLWRQGDMGAWILGALVAAGMAVGFVLSRTLGLPGFHEHDWELSGIVSLLLEGGFLAAATAALSPVARPRHA
jgi:hypothetical protein